MDNNRKNRAKAALLFRLALSFVVIFGIYVACCRLEFKPIVPIYAILSGVLFIVYFITTRGRAFAPKNAEGEDGEDKRPPLTRVQRLLLLLIIPLFLTIAIDYLYLTFFDSILTNIK